MAIKDVVSFGFGPSGAQWIPTFGFGSGFIQRASESDVYLRTPSDESTLLRTQDSDTPYRRTAQSSDTLRRV